MAKKKTNNSIVPVEVVKEAESNASIAIQKAKTMTVTTIKEEEVALDALIQIKKAIKTVENKRKEITSPINASLKATNTMFKKLSAPFIDADKIIRDKVMDFRRAREEKAQKELERRQKIQASHEAKGHETKEIVVPKTKVSGETVVAKRWTFDTLDVSKIPLEYLIVDTVAVNKAIRNGVREIPGLDIYQVEGLRI